MSHHAVTFLHEARASEMRDPPPGATRSLSSNEMLNVWEIGLSRRGSFLKFPLVVPCFYFPSPSLLCLSDCAFNVLSTPNPLSKWNSFDLLGRLKTFTISAHVIHSCRPGKHRDYSSYGNAPQLLRWIIEGSLPLQSSYIGLEQALRSLSKPGISSSPV